MTIDKIEDFIPRSEPLANICDAKKQIELDRCRIQILDFDRGWRFFQDRVATQQDGMHYSVAMDSVVFFGESDGGRTEKLQRVESFFAHADFQANIPENILHMLWTSHAIAIGFGAGLAQSGDVGVFMSDRAALIHAYNVTREVFELCRRRGADPYKASSEATLYKLPPWLFALAIKWYSASDPGLKRVLSRLNQTTNEKELREACSKLRKN
jgi:ketopantoate reductase